MRNTQCEENVRKPRDKKNVVGISETCRKFMRADTNGSTSSIDASIRAVLIPSASILAAMVSSFNTAAEQNIEEWVSTMQIAMTFRIKCKSKKICAHTRVLLSRASHRCRVPRVRALSHRARRGGSDDIDAAHCRCDQQAGEGMCNARGCGRVELNVE